MPEENEKMLENGVEEPATKETEGNDRASWDRSVQFLLSMLGYAVGMGNVLRFPYVCMANGGGAFLIPFLVVMVMFCMPMAFLEMTIGQRTQQGCVSCWDQLAPVLKGVGYGMLSLSALCTIYYQAIYTWIIYYIANSFTWELPWTKCNETWNTPNCVLTSGAHDNATINSTLISNYGNGSFPNNGNLNNLTVVMDTRKSLTASEEYFRYGVLEITSGIEDFGGLRWEMVVAHIIGWLAIYLCVIKGVGSVGKVIYVTATMPYLFFVIFLIRAAILPGSIDGVKYFITPVFEKLGRPQIWAQAFMQVFLSFGIGWGGIITMASYNKYKHPMYREAIAVPLAVAGTSLLCGFIVFSMVGFLAHKTGVSVENAVAAGPELAFVTYPEIAAHLPGAPIWALLFFIMLLMTGADSQFVTFETCVSAICDQLKIRRKFHIYIVTGSTIVAAVLGLPFITRGGVYLWQVVDWYAFCIGPFVFATVECLTLWLYGFDRFFADIESMIGKQPLKFLFVPLWGAVIPFILLTGMVWSLLRFSPPEYGDYTYPYWVGYLGFSVSCAIAIPVPIAMIVRLIRVEADSFSERCCVAFRPYRQREVEDKPDEFEFLDADQIA